MSEAESTERMFSVLRDRKDQPGVPVEVPWALLETRRARIEAFHGQTLERLEERGGLSVCELAAHLTGKSPLVLVDRGDGARLLKRELDKWTESRPKA